jgi:hypothetical protein
MAKIEPLIERLKTQADSGRLDVRCPTCGVGRGHWCRDAAGRAIVHAARHQLPR